MKIPSFLILLILFPLFLAAQVKPADTAAVFKDGIEMPSFPGGDMARHKFFAEHMIYPTDAAEYGTQGTVFVTFTVEADGTLKDVKVLKGIGRGCDEEAVRVIKSMPKWNPGKNKGVPVPVEYNLPVKFQINEENRYNQK